MLSDDSGRLLLQLAKKALTESFNSQLLVLPREDTIPDELRQPAGVFVTLRIGPDLRGCIGNIAAVEPLYRQVMMTAVETAREDTRFAPLSEKEVPRLHVEISVLSPFQKIEKIEEVIPRKHGVLIQRGYRKGLFLPQVWQESGWDRVKFLNELCESKAGLPPAAWENPETELYVFEIQAFEAQLADIKPLAATIR